MLRVMYRQRGSARRGHSKGDPQTYETGGVVKPLDEESVGTSGVIRYVDQAAAMRRQLMKQGVIAGAGPDGFRLTPEGKKLAEELLPDLKTKQASGLPETDKP